MGEIITKTNIPRDKGWIYYCGTDKETGNLTICKAKSGRQGRKKKEKIE